MGRPAVRLPFHPLFLLALEARPLRGLRKWQLLVHIYIPHNRTPCGRGALQLWSLTRSTCDLPLRFSSPHLTNRVYHIRENKSSPFSQIFEKIFHRGRVQSKKPRVPAQDARPKREGAFSAPWWTWWEGWRSALFTSSPRALPTYFLHGIGFTWRVPPATLRLW